MGLSGSTATTSRDGWQRLDTRLQAGDVVTVAAVDRVGRSWRNTIGVLRNLSDRKVRVVSLADSETWLHYLFAADDSSVEAQVGDVLANMIAWLAQAERDATVRRTLAGLARARAEGKRLGRPQAGAADLREHAAQLRAEGHGDQTDRQDAEPPGEHRPRLAPTLGAPTDSGTNPTLVNGAVLCHLCRVRADSVPRARAYSIFFFLILSIYIYLARVVRACVTCARSRARTQAQACTRVYAYTRMCEHPRAGCARNVCSTGNVVIIARFHRYAREDGILCVTAQYSCPIRHPMAAQRPA